MLLEQNTSEKIKSSRCSHVVFASIFWTYGLVVNLIQLIIYITVRPISKTTFRSINQYFTHFMWSKCVFLVQWWSRSLIQVYATDEDFQKFQSENKVIITNHTYEVDWIFLFSLFENTGQLAGYKDFTKAENKWIPIAGWSMFFAEWIGLKRNYQKDKVTIERDVNEVFSFPHVITLNYYAEGTRFTEEKHKKSVEFAVNKGLSPLKYLLTPRTKGFTVFLPIIRKQSEALYDVIVTFREGDGAAPKIMNLLYGRQMSAHIYLKRIQIAEIPGEEKDAVDWLHNLYVEKDKKIDHFHKTGTFDLPSRVLRSSLSILVIEIIAAVFLYGLIGWSVVHSITNQCWGFIMIISAVFGLLYVLLLQVARFSEVNSKHE